MSKALGRYDGELFFIKNIELGDDDGKMASINSANWTVA